MTLGISQKQRDTWSWSVQNNNDVGHRNVLREIYSANKLRTIPDRLPVLLGWLQECLAPQAMTWALDAYIPEIIANDDYRTQVMAYFVSQLHAESPPQVMPATGKFNFTVSTTLSSQPKSNANTQKQRQIACFIEEIATTTEEYCRPSSLITRRSRAHSTPASITMNYRSNIYGHSPSEKKPSSPPMCIPAYCYF